MTLFVRVLFCDVLYHYYYCMVSCLCLRVCSRLVILVCVCVNVVFCVYYMLLWWGEENIVCIDIVVVFAWVLLMCL